MKNLNIAIPVALILTDTQKKIQYINKEFSKMSGYSLDEIVGKTPAVLQGIATDRIAVLHINDAIKKHEVVRSSILNYRKNKDCYECNLLIHPILNESQEVEHYLAFEIDGIDELKNKILDTLAELKICTAQSDDSLEFLKDITAMANASRLLHTEMLYLNPDLTLSALAKKLHIGSKHLSQIINKYTCENKSRYLNHFRINLVKEKLREKKYDTLTIYAVAQSCGFKNKSTFFKVFQELTGTTPKDFIRSSGFSQSFDN